MRANDGAWIGWSGGSDDDIEPFVEDGLSLVPVPLSAEEVEEFYEGFSNATLWPLYHDVVAKPEFHREWWEAYVRVNRRFAEKTAAVAAEDATVWVHDYQLQLVPAMLRDLRPDLRIGFFLHIPFPPAELFQQLPWRRQLLEGLLGADVVGFQRPGASQNFVRLVRQRVGHKTHRDMVYLPDGRVVQAGAFPISIDTAGLEELARTERRPAARQGDPRAARQPARGCCSASTGSTTPRASTTGCARSASWSRDGEVSVEDAVFVQVATPSRERVEQYRRLRDEIDRLVGRINGDLGTDRQPADPLPAHLLPQGGDGGAVPGRRRHGGHAAARRHEPGRQGVRRVPVRRPGRAGAVRVRRCRRRAAAGVHGQPLRHQRDEGRHRRPR